MMFSEAYAQVGASSSPLLMKPAATSEGVAHGRYQIKKVAPALVPESQRKNKLRTPASEEENKAQVQEAPAEKPVPSPARLEYYQTGEPKEEPNIPSPTLKEEAQSLVGTDTEKVLSFYKEQIHPDDIRNNRIEIQASPSLVYNGSQANYSFRSYSSFFSAMDIASNVWMTPSIGLTGRVLFSFGATVGGDSSTSSTTLARYEDLDFGIKFRRYFGISRMANSIEFDLLYSDHQMQTPSDNIYRPTIDSAGLGLKMISRIPTSANFAWIFTGSFFPRLQHKEDKTGIDIRSGSPGENTRVGVSAGSEVKFSRESQIIYDLGITTERNTFDGTASPLDPDTNKNPTNVSVTNTFVMFSFGYRWAR
jgi:hypothetical protein